MQYNAKGPSSLQFRLLVHKIIQTNPLRTPEVILLSPLLKIFLTKPPREGCRTIFLDILVVAVAILHQCPRTIVDSFQVINVTEDEFECSR